MQHERRTRRAPRHDAHIHIGIFPAAPSLRRREKRRAHLRRQLVPIRHALDAPTMTQRRREQNQTARLQPHQRRQRRARRPRRMSDHRAESALLRGDFQNTLRQHRHMRLPSRRLAVRRSIKRHHAKPRRDQRFRKSAQLRRAPRPTMRENHQRRVARTPSPLRQFTPTRRCEPPFRRRQISVFAQRNARGRRRPQENIHGQLRPSLRGIRDGQR